MNSSQAVSHGFPITNLQTGSSWKSNRGFKRVLDTELLQTGAVRWLLNLPGWLPAHLPLSSTLKPVLDDSAWFFLFLMSSRHHPPLTPTQNLLRLSGSTVGHLLGHLIDLRRRELLFSLLGPDGAKIEAPKNNSRKRDSFKSFSLLEWR